jgi:cytochrome c
MSTCKLGIWIGVACLTVCTAGTALAQRGPNLGVEATPEQVAGWDVSIPPDGRGLPPGSGDAATGEKIFAAQCQVCHGEAGAGLVNDRLVGGQGTLGTAKPVKTIGSYWPYATTVFDYIRRAMPYPQPHSLSNDQAYALTAYLLYLNGIIKQSDEIDADTLPKIKMPNRDGFIRVFKPPTK